VATASLEVLVNEDLSNRADRLGKHMRAGLEALKSVGPHGGWIQEVRGKGLLNAIVIDQSKSMKGRGAWELCLLFKSKGLLAKVCHHHHLSTSKFDD
jgi:ornithine--oxo-acid transaminase